MAAPPPADHTALKTNSGSQTATKVSYAATLKANPRPTELAARAAKKAFVHGIDTNVIGTSAMVNGRKTIFLSKEENEYMAAPFQYALVGKFSHGYPTMTRLRAKFASLDLKNGFKIGLLDHKHTWYFDGYPMRVLKWTSDFNPSEESPIMPIWIKIFGLRPHWFHRGFLYHIASLIGKPLKLDEATTEIDNPVVARICVEVNVLEKLQFDVPIQIDDKTHYFKVQYEGIPEYCRICRHRGHSIAACFKGKESNEDDKLPESDTEATETEDLREKLNKKRGKQPEMDASDGADKSPSYIRLRDHSAGLEGYKDVQLKEKTKFNDTKENEEIGSSSNIGGDGKQVDGEKIYMVHENPTHEQVGENSNINEEGNLSDIERQKIDKLAMVNFVPIRSKLVNKKSGYTDEMRRAREEVLVASPSAGEQDMLGHEVVINAMDWSSH
ncbi:hypothetical protein BUALT_Bualt04G0051100 [Buddleja alternifolia]|uniref:DUF4283 domain-containing protein n=1 Tax=Buddleja alternifolia TaxID=168488 RepID=A0AAV6XXC1_9LAMI|nr:hypothetical protein BUALT_Bualt04G0051100 [Buddleja alternifolia]